MGHAVSPAGQTVFFVTLLLLARALLASVDGAEPSSHDRPSEEGIYMGSHEIPHCLKLNGQLCRRHCGFRCSPRNASLDTVIGRRTSLGGKATGVNVAEVCKWLASTDTEKTNSAREVFAMQIGNCLRIASSACLYSRTI